MVTTSRIEKRVKSAPGNKATSNARSEVANRAAQDLIDSRRLFYFYHVARLGSFTTAEAVLDIAQPAMSRQIQQLESDVGARLLQRTGRGVALTDVGRIVYRHAEKIFADMRETYAEINAALHHPKGQISIAAPTFFIRSYMAPVVNQYANLFPDVRLRVIEGSTGHVSELLAAGEVDIAVVLQVPTSRKIRTQKLISEHMDLAVGKNHPMAARRVVTRKELNGQAFCVAANAHGSRMLIEQYCREGDIKLDIRMELDSMYLMKTVIRSLPVLGFIPAHDLESHDELVTVPLDPPLVRTMYLSQLDLQDNSMIAPLVAALKASVKTKASNAAARRAVQTTAQKKPTSTKKG